MNRVVLMVKKKIPLFFSVCLILISLVFVISCTRSESQAPLAETEPPIEEPRPSDIDEVTIQPDNQSGKDVKLPDQPKTGLTEPEPAPAEIDPSGEFQNTSRDFVNTIAGILSSDDVVLTDKNIRELEEIISILEEAHGKMANNAGQACDDLSEVQKRLRSLREELRIEPVEFAELHVPPPERTGDKYVILSGIWLRETRLALRDLERHKEDGANSILITVPLDCDAELNFSTPSKEALAMYVQAAHASGMGVVLSLCQGPPAGYSRGWHDAFFGGNVEVSGEAALGALTPFVIEWVEFAEEYDVEVFMPVIEPIMWASMDTRYWEMDDQSAGEICGIVTDWMRALLPTMKERYSGELMFATHNRVVGDSPFFELDFSGYDYIANWESGEEIVTQLSQECRSTGTCQGLIHHITLYVGGLEFEPAYVLTEDEQATAYHEYFRQTWNREMTAGVMLDLGIGKEYFGRPAELVIESWLADIDKVPVRNIDTLWSTRGLFEILDKILSPSEVTYSEEWLYPPSHD